MLVVPFVKGYLHHKTAQTPGAEFVELPLEDKYAYWRLIKRLYEHGDDFAIIEHDIIITEAQLDDWAACPEEWCVYGYRRGGGDFVALGALRLRRSIWDRMPRLLSTAEIPAEVYFDQCDGILYGALKSIGLEPHRHSPDVGHEQSAARALWEFKICREPQAQP